MILASGVASGSVVVVAASITLAPFAFAGIVLSARIALETAVFVFRLSKNAAYIARRCSPDD
jgi:hypothetical protein